MPKMSKIGFAIANSVFENIWVTINGLLKMLFFNFCFFKFFRISNDYCQKSYEKTILFYNGLGGFS